MKQSVKINGMNCMHCIRAVKEALTEITGVENLDVKIGSAEFDAPDSFDMKIVFEAIEEAGYEPVK
ncbi:MAG: ATPase P [Spirochaetes bacterium GWF1_51_8]|nr:MAG: ATPase P [Spirochaetes bacterium GWF1_51_8]